MRSAINTGLPELWGRTDIANAIPLPPENGRALVFWSRKERTFRLVKGEGPADVMSRLTPTRGTLSPLLDEWARQRGAGW